MDYAQPGAFATASLERRNQVTDFLMQHPYVRYEGGVVWRLLDGAIADLEENQDLTITTARSHVLGYLCKQLAALENGGSLQDAVVWRWLCEREWPAHLDDDQRLELARDVVRIADAGTVEHVVDFLRNMLPATVKPTPAAVAPKLMDILARSRTGPGAGAF